VKTRSGAVVAVLERREMETPRKEEDEIAHGTNVSRNAPEHPTGPIYLQGDHGAVAFQNLKVTPLN
jgi:hypothetical protein